jgi:hypothetical protein
MYQLYQFFQNLLLCIYWCASYELGKANLPNGYIAAGESKVPLGIEIALVTEQVENTHKSAISNGAVEIKDPEKTPWGHLVSYIRFPYGVFTSVTNAISIPSGTSDSPAAI